MDSDWARSERAKSARRALCLIDWSLRDRAALKYLRPSVDKLIELQIHVIISRPTAHVLATGHDGRKDPLEGCEVQFAGSFPVSPFAEVQFTDATRARCCPIALRPDQTGREGNEV